MHPREVLPCSATMAWRAAQTWLACSGSDRATLSVDEKGAIATTATAVGVQALALPIPLLFNRPYLLIIRDMLTGEPLMMAWVANPAQD